MSEVDEQVATDTPDHPEYIGATNPAVEAKAKAAREAASAAKE
jgi:hypothetical protein